MDALTISVAEDVREVTLEYTEHFAQEILTACGMRRKCIVLMGSVIDTLRAEIIRQQSDPVNAKKIEELTSKFQMLSDIDDDVLFPMHWVVRAVLDKHGEPRKTLDWWGTASASFDYTAAGREMLYNAVFGTAKSQQFEQNNSIGEATALCEGVMLPWEWKITRSGLVNVSTVVKLVFGVDRISTELYRSREFNHICEVAAKLNDDIGATTGGVAVELADCVGSECGNVGDWTAHGWARTQANGVLAAERAAQGGCSTLPAVSLWAGAVVIGAKGRPDRGDDPEVDNRCRQHGALPGARLSGHATAGGEAGDRRCRSSPRLPRDGQCGARRSATSANPCSAKHQTHRGDSRQGSKSTTAIKEAESIDRRK